MMGELVPLTEQDIIRSNDEGYVLGLRHGREEIKVQLNAVIDALALLLNIDNHEERKRIIDNVLFNINKK